MKLRLSGEIKHSFVNGPGTRYVVFFQGCPHNCPGCQNPETHDMQGGVETDISEVIARIAATKLLDGVTLSGGDPLAQPAACAELAKAVHNLGLDVWVYTGWTFEELMKEGKDQYLNDIDVLVDGPYREVDQDTSSSNLWRGSSNQRLIDVKESMKKRAVVLAASN